MHNRHLINRYSKKPINKKYYGVINSSTWNQYPKPKKRKIKSEMITIEVLHTYHDIFSGFPLTTKTLRTLPKVQYEAEQRAIRFALKKKNCFY